MVFEKAIQKTTPADEVKQRVINLTDEITYSVYMYTARGLFERDKLIFLAQVTFQVKSRVRSVDTRLQALCSGLVNPICISARSPGDLRSKVPDVRHT